MSEIGHGVQGSPETILFARKLASTPPFPANGDFVSFDFATLTWVLKPASGLSVTTSSNVGAGAGLALPKVGVDLPFKSLLGNPEIVLTPTATTIDFSVGSIAQSKIFGLVTALLTKLETLSNVGAGEGIALAKVGVDNPLKSLTAAGGITLTGNPNDIEIKSADTFVLGYHTDKSWKAVNTFGAPFTSKADQDVEADAQAFFNFAYTVREITVFISNNIAIANSTITLKRNSVSIGATTITIPALTTGKFSISVTEAFAVADEIHDVHICPTKNDIKNTSYNLECSRP